MSDGSDEQCSENNLHSLPHQPYFHSRRADDQSWYHKSSSCRVERVWVGGDATTTAPITTLKSSGGVAQVPSLRDEDERVKVLKLDPGSNNNGPLSSRFKGLRVRVEGNSFLSSPGGSAAASPTSSATSTPTSRSHVTHQHHHPFAVPTSATRAAVVGGGDAVIAKAGRLCTVVTVEAGDSPLRDYPLPPAIKKTRGNDHNLFLSTPPSSAAVTPSSYSHQAANRRDNRLPAERQWGVHQASSSDMTQQHTTINVAEQTPQSKAQPQRSHRPTDAAHTTPASVSEVQASVLAAHRSNTDTSPCSCSCIGKVLWAALKSPFFLLYIILAVVFSLLGAIWGIVTLPMRCGSDSHRKVNAVRDYYINLI
eukprot:1195583-Prorocentrum_minimum.AAC.2